MSQEGQKIRVVHLITLLELGGAQGNTITTVTGLNPNEFEAHLWAGKGAYWDQEAMKKLAPSGRLAFFSNLVRSIHPFKDSLALCQLFGALKKLQPAILHTHSSKAGILGRMAGWLAGVPCLIHTFHGFGFNDEQTGLIRFLFITLEKWAARITTKLIFVSEANRETAKKEGIGKPDQHLLIRSGIPVSSLQEEAKSVDRGKVKADLNLKGETRVVTTIGPFKPQKNLSDAIRVARKTVDKTGKVVFLIVGDGSLRPKLEKEIQDQGLQQHVRLLGWRRDIAKILAITDVFILTSLWEGLPRALVEALALGVYPVCYDTDGVRDLLGQGAGALVPKKDTQAMADAIERILNRGTLPSFPPREQEEKIRRDFDIDHMVRQQEILYHQLVKTT